MAFKIDFSGGSGPRQPVRRGRTPISVLEKRNSNPVRQGRTPITILEERNRATETKTTPTYSGSTGSGGGSAPSTPTGPSPEEIARREAARQAAAAKRAAAKAERQARQRENRGARSSANSTLDDLNAKLAARRGQKQTNLSSLEALKSLVGGKGKLADVRRDTLAEIGQSLETKMAQIETTFENAMEGYNANQRDNEATEADTSYSNLANRARERGDTTEQALSQGAGESDILRAQMQALRNWQQNQENINRSYFDTQSSINSAISGLNQDTRTSMINEEQGANSARGQTWDDYYSAAADTFTQMSNLDQQNYLLSGEIDSIKDQKGSSQAVLDWLNSGKNYEDYEEPESASKRVSGQAPAYESEYAQKAANAAGSSWKDPGVSKATENWEGAEGSDATLASSTNTRGGTTANRKRPEGATLRRW